MRIFSLHTQPRPFAEHKPSSGAAGSCLLTGADAGPATRPAGPRRAPRSTGSLLAGSTFGLALGLGLLAPLPAQAQSGEKDALNAALPWEINHEDPSAGMPSQEEANKNPLGFGYYLMSITDLAIEAEEAEDWTKARRYYGALATGVPQRAVGFQYLCKMDRKLKDHAKAVESCAAPLSREGVETVDFLNYVKAVSDAPDAIAIKHKDKVLNAMDHFQKEHPAPAMRGRCLMGTRFSDQALLELCVPAVLAADKDKPSIQSLSFAWNLEILREDWDAAQAYVDQIRELGGEENTVRAMGQLVQDGRDKDSAGLWRMLRRGLLGLSVVGLIWYWRRRKDEEPQA